MRLQERESRQNGMEAKTCGYESRRVDWVGEAGGEDVSFDSELEIKEL